MTEAPPRLLLHGGRVVVPDGVTDPGWLTVADGVIEHVGRGLPPAPLAAGRDVVDLAGRTVLPGFIDLHVHGAVGHEVMDAEQGALVDMSAFFATHGVTSFLATTWTATEAETAAALGSVADAALVRLPGARLLGAHMEGPYLNRDRCGAHDPTLTRPPDPDEARRLFDAGPVRMITLAPELARAHELIDLCLDRGVRVSIGHTTASYEQVLDAVRWGARQLTHTFNAMPPLLHRAPGPVGAAIMVPELLADLIADTHHVHPAAMRALLRAKGPDGLALITDALRPTGLGAGSYVVGGHPAEVRDGAVRRADGTLAGSLLTMDVALRNLARADETSAEQLWRTSSRNAAIAAGLADRKGLLAAGMDADLVVVDESVTVAMTVVAGRVVYRAGGFGSPA